MKALTIWRTLKARGLWTMKAVSFVAVFGLQVLWVLPFLPFWITALLVEQVDSAIFFLADRVVEPWCELGARILVRNPKLQRWWLS